MENLKTGNWVTLERISAYSLIVIVFWVLGYAYLLVTSNGNLDVMGRPLGTDFANTWSSGKQALEGNAALVYDFDVQKHAQYAAFAKTQGQVFDWHYPWLYPPMYLLVAGFLAMLPTYGWALFAWLFATLSLYILVMRRIVEHRLGLLVAMGFPAVGMNIGHGQNGFLTAALMGAGLLALDRRAVAAGVAFGLLTYKPQFGILIPLILVIDGRWRVIAAATLTAAGLGALCTGVFGVGIWRAFWDNSAFARVQVLESGAMGWEKLQSLFAALRVWGLDVPVAYVGQGALALGVLICVVWLWRRDVAFALKAAGLCAGALLMTPYVLDYDLVVLGLSIAWMVAHGLKNGFLSWEKTILAFVWMVPLFARNLAYISHVPIGLMAIVLIFGLVMRRAVYDVHHERHKGSITADA